MATFVLVHPAWFGGWCWKKVVPLLRAQGHEVHTPTLTGLGERAHLATPEVGLSTHIADVVNVMSYEDLGDVVLVGNSSGGNVITGVADRVPERIAQLVYLDAFVPADGQGIVDMLPPDRRQTVEALVQAEGDGWLWPRFSPAPWEEIARRRGRSSTRPTWPGCCRGCARRPSGTSRSRRPSGVTPTCLRACTSGRGGPTPASTGSLSTRVEPWLEPLGARRLAHPVRDVGRAARHDAARPRRVDQPPGRMPPPDDRVRRRCRARPRRSGR